MADTDSESVKLNCEGVNGETGNGMHRFLDHSADIGYESLQNHSLASEIEEMLEKAVGPLTLDCCIYRVPHDIRKLNEEAYTPKLVSIGPYHHGNERLQNMERHKRRYLQKFLERAEIQLPHVINSIELWEPSVRLSYAETIDLSKDELITLILIDAGFIIELFWRSHFNVWENDDPILLKPWLLSNLILDLLLLENQLPFFVIDSIFNLAFASYSQQNSEFPSFATLTFDYFGLFNKRKLSPIQNFRHFTDLLRIFFLPPQDKLPPRKDKSVMRLPAATRLKEAGVKFRQSSSQCLFDFTFSGKVLQIPCFKLEDQTEILFRNMVALEQCHYPHHGYVTDYIAILDFLINTAKDVDLLVRKGILVNWLGDSETAARLVNSLWRNVAQETVSSRFLELCEELNEFYGDIWHKRKAALKRDYCNTPWKTAASIAGVILLILSVVQTVCSVLQLKHR